MRAILVSLLISSCVFGQAKVETINQQSIESIGNGVIPAGLLDPDLKVVQQARVEAAKASVDALYNRFAAGLDNIGFLMEAQLDYVDARLEVAETKQDRLQALMDGVKLALDVWQRVKELERVGAKGGDHASETRARAQVFKLRLRWLKENESSSEKRSADTSPSTVPNSGVDTTLTAPICNNAINSAACCPEILPAHCRKPRRSTR